MGSTTYREYRHFERDRALARRFQRIDVSEPSVADTVKILEGLRARYEAHHGVKYTGIALKGAAELAAKHITDRFLPDKAIDVMDEAGAAVKLRKGKSRDADKRSVGLGEIEATVARMARIPVARAFERSLALEHSRTI
jgi:ATP-dependent Clp protease ATP-binding subunit ClpA